MIDFNKYNIIFEGLCHYYKIDLSSLTFIDYESSSLHYIKLFDEIYHRRNWTQAMIWITNKLIDYRLTSIESLLVFKSHCTSQELFANTTTNYFIFVREGLYINNNIGTSRRILILKELITKSAVDFKDIEVLAKKAPQNEDASINDFFGSRNIDLFVRYLQPYKNEGSIRVIINSLKNFDKYFSILFPTKKSLFLFESGGDFSNYCGRFKKEIQNITSLSNIQKDKIKLYLDLLKSFYYETYKLSKGTLEEDVELVLDNLFEGEDE